MTAVIVELFRYEQHEVRSVVVDGQPWFVAADVCAVLDIANPRSSVSLLDEDERGVHTVDTPGGAQAVAIVNEPGLYSLILRSRKPEAKAFKRWITHQVIPAIRRTGSYSNAPALPQTYAEALRELASAVEEREQLATQVAELAPAAESWNTLATAEGDFLVADAAKILSRDPNITVGQNRLYTLLGQLGWIFRAAGDRRWRTKQTAIETGRLSEIPMSHYHPRTGELVLDPPQIRVTVKGLGYLHKHLGGAGQPALPAA